MQEGVGCSPSEGKETGEKREGWREGGVKENYEV